MDGMGEDPPVILPTGAGRKAACRPLSDPGVTMEHVPEPHHGATVDRRRTRPVIPAMRDTTTVDHSHLQATEGLPETGGGGSGSVGCRGPTARRSACGTMSPHRTPPLHEKQRRDSSCPTQTASTMDKDAATAFNNPVQTGRQLEPLFHTLLRRHIRIPDREPVPFNAASLYGLSEPGNAKHVEFMIFQQGQDDASAPFLDLVHIETRVPVERCAIHRWTFLAGAKSDAQASGSKRRIVDVEWVIFTVSGHEGHLLILPGQFNSAKKSGQIIVRWSRQTPYCTRGQPPAPPVVWPAALHDIWKGVPDGIPHAFSCST